MAYCSTCGREIMEGGQFCAHCGERTHPSSSRSASHGFDVSDEEIKLFVGSNASVYLEKFRKFNAGGAENFAATWHWPAFLFGFWWMLYRKLYLWALAEFILSLIPYGNILARIGFGVCGNYIYYRHVKRKTGELKASSPRFDISPALVETGGVHRWVIVVGVIVNLLLLVFIFLVVTVLGTILGTR